MTGGAHLTALVSGMLVAGYLVAGLHFLRFWRRSRDRLFLLFSAAFGVLAVQRLALVLLAGHRSAEPYLYLLRALAFLVIIVGIVDRNRGGSRS
jgi:hypothetical protein